MAQAEPVESTLYLEPPYRLETWKELMVFSSYRKTGISYSIALVDKAKQLKISHPPLMPRLPENRRGA